MTKSILIVEDEQSLRQALSLKLKKEGFAVFEAKTGQEGIEMAKSKSPDLILLDIMMPEMNGLDVLAEMKSYIGLVKTPVIILTNLPEENAEAKAKERGAVEYLVKSNCPLEKLVEKIKGYLQKETDDFRGGK